MKTQWTRLVAMVGFGALVVLASSDAFALGRSHKSGYRGWQQSDSGTTNGGGSVINVDQGNTGNEPPPRDSNPVPEPASLVLLGSALAGLGGYRGLRKRLARR